MAKLWFNENMRVFHDRLTTELDREYMRKLLIDQFHKFGLDKSEVIDCERIIFADFLNGREADPKFY
jgi:dynein heavy chain, axonemal